MICLGIAIAILVCIAAFFLGHSLGKNENDISKDSKVEDEVKKEIKLEEDSTVEQRKKNLKYIVISLK